MMNSFSLIIEYLRKRGYETEKASFYAKIKEWLEWYKCNVDDYHHYTIYNGTQVVEKIIKSLGMAKTVCESWANLLMNEKVDISTGDTKSDEILNNILDDNNYRVKANQLCELAMALGSGAFVEYISNDEIRIDYIRADMIYPLSWDTRGIHECAFGSVIKKNGKDCIQLQLHTLDNKKEEKEYIIENLLIEVDDSGGQEFSSIEGVPRIVETHSNVPCFQIITPNIINNVDLDSPMGISVYANALDCLTEIDATFDALDVEINTGRRMILMSSELYYTDDNGIRHNVMSDKETVIRFIGEAENGAEKSLIHDFSPNFRIAPLKEALQLQLNLLSEKVGMGTNSFEFGQGGVKTATEIISEDSDLFVNLKKHELVLQRAIEQMVKAIAFLGSQVGININVKEIKVDFDDSIIEDTGAERLKDMQDLANGTYRADEYRAKWRNETLEDAQKNLPRTSETEILP